MTDRNVTQATFTLERTYGASPDLVFNAWADPVVKARWFARGASNYELDFRPGGLERNSTTLEGRQITWEALYRDIVDQERIVYTSVLREGGVVATASLTTVELVPEGDGTHLILSEFGAYLDGREQPAWREQGTGEWLDALGRDLARQDSDDPASQPIHSRFISRKEAAMAIDHVLAVVPVSDFNTAHQWYERLFGRPADNLPMEDRLVEWRITTNGWVQITTDPVRAGSALLNFAVDDLDSHIAELARRGLQPGEIEPVNKGVLLSPIRDPDGNTITFIGDFRIHY